MNVHGPVFQGGATVTAPVAALAGVPMVPAGTALFARTGVLLPAPGDSSDTFKGVLLTASGRMSASEDWTVPLLAGVSVPAVSLGIPVGGLSFEVFGGGQIKQRKIGLSFTETGFGAVGGASGARSSTDIDPAAGLGLQYALGNVGAMPVSLGANVTYDFAPRSSLTLQSPNFPSVTYTAARGSRVEVSGGVTLNVGLPPLY